MTAPDWYTPPGGTDAPDVIAALEDLAAAIDARLHVGGQVMPVTMPVVADCIDRLGVDPASTQDVEALTAALLATISYVTRQRPDLLTTVDAAASQGIVMMACLDYRARNSPAGFAGYDGGYMAPDTPEKFRAMALLRIDRYGPPRVG
jgi:hypothetical protein